MVGLIIGVIKLGRLVINPVVIRLKRVRDEIGKEKKDQNLPHHEAHANN